MDRKILNLGCGNDMYGTHRIDVFKTSATTEVADINGKLPYPDNYFDEIYCKSVLEHIKNLGMFSDECFRVLRGGEIVAQNRPCRIFVASPDEKTRT